LIKVERAPLAEEDVRNIEGAVRLAARWNGNRSWNREVALVTDDLDLLKQEGFTPGRHSMAIGWCMWRRGKVAIWVKPGQRGVCLTTLIHEFAHAFVSRTSDHDSSFRRLYGLGYVASWCMYAKDILQSPTEAIEETIWRYTAPREGGWYGAGANAQYHTWETRDEYTMRVDKEACRLGAAAAKFVRYLDMTELG
jgi:hypothetical protein